MPRKHIYIRVEDVKKFNTIEDVPKWLHEAIQQEPKPPKKQETKLGSED